MCVGGVTGSSVQYSLRLTQKSCFYRRKPPPENVECPQYLLPCGLARGDKQRASNTKAAPLTGTHISILQLCCRYLQLENSHD